MHKCIRVFSVLVMAGVFLFATLATAEQQKMLRPPLGETKIQAYPTDKIPLPITSSATVTAVPASQTGNCPLTATFKGKITLSGISPLTKPIEVKYRLKFVAPGTDSLVYTMTFTKLGAQDFSHTFPGFGNSNLPAYSGSVWVEIISPKKVESKQAPFSFKCSNM